MNLSPAVASTSPGAGPACNAACGGNPGGGVDFAAVLISLSASPAASPEMLVAAPAEDVATETPVGEAIPNPLQALLAGLLAVPAEQAAPALADSPTDQGDGVDALATELASAPKKGRGELTALAIQAESAGKQADTAAAANPVLPAAAKLADAGRATTDAARMAAGEVSLELPPTDGEGNSPTSSAHASLGPFATSATARGASAIAHVATPVGSPAWAGELGQRMVMLARSDAQTAQITLHPAHLGPIEVRLSLSGGEATAVFVSPHSDVREALETALPRLREMFAGAGIELGQAQVNAQSRGSGGRDEPSGSPASLARRTEVGDVLADNEGIRLTRPIGRGLIDTFV
jgi:flagellar hook-length control protein FliK